jgi:glycosyltransferase 2 family protein
VANPIRTLRGLLAGGSLASGVDALVAALGSCLAADARVRLTGHKESIGTVLRFPKRMEHRYKDQQAETLCRILQPPVTRHMQRFALLTGLLLSAVFAWLALADTRWADLRSAFALAQLWLGIPFVLVLASFYWLKAERWRWLLAPTAQIPTRTLLPALVVGFAANNLLPAHLGELIRVHLLGRELGLPRSAVLATVVLERLFDVLALLALVIVALVTSAELAPELRAAGSFLAIVGVLTLLPAGLLAFRTEWFKRMSEPLLARLPATLSARLHAQIDVLARGFGALRAGHRLPAIVANSLVQWALMTTCVWIAILAFHLPVPWVAAFSVLVISVAGITLPSSPGYFGAIEYCFVLGLKAYGVNAGTALSVAIFYHTLTWAPVTLAGTFFLRRYRLSWRALRHDPPQS